MGDRQPWCFSLCALVSLREHRANQQRPTKTAHQVLSPSQLLYSQGFHMNSVRSKGRLSNKKTKYNAQHSPGPSGAAEPLIIHKFSQNTFPPFPPLFLKLCESLIISSEENGEQIRLNVSIWRENSCKLVDSKKVVKHLQKQKSSQNTVLLMT